MAKSNRTPNDQKATVHNDNNIEHKSMLDNRSVQIKNKSK